MLSFSFATHPRTTLGEAALLALTAVSKKKANEGLRCLTGFVSESSWTGVVRDFIKPQCMR
jgi:hypothetical protein